MAQLAGRLAASRRGPASGELRWFSVGAAGVATLVLGIWGFEAFSPDTPWTEHAYRTLQLAVLESGNLGGTIPWQLEIARIAAPALAAYSALRSAVYLSRDRLDLLLARRSAGHVVVCGLGERGTLLAQGLRGAGHVVVAVERNPGCVGIDQVRRAGAAVVVGDATDAATLERAGIREATHVVSMCDRAAIDAEVALAARRLSTDRRDALSCRLEIDQPVLADLLEKVQLGEHYDQGFRLDFLDLWGSAARALVDRFPPAGGVRPHIVVVGLGRFGGSVVAEVARRRHLQDPDAEPVSVTVIDPRGEEAVRALLDRLPHLRSACCFEVRAEDASSPDGAGALKGMLGVAEAPGAVYVCVPDEATALTIGLQSRSWLPAGTGEVVVRMTRHGGLAQALEEIVGVGAGIYAFAALDAALAPAIVLGGRVEQIARALHDEYRGTRPPGPATVEWDRLPEDVRESNRDQARHIGVKLRAAGCHLAPLASWDTSGFVFTDEEVERLARMEHDRWVAERQRAGWTPGRRRAGATTSPHLVPWDDLAEDVRGIDRAFVLALPGVLGAAGYEIHRGRPIQGAAHHDA